MKHRTVFVKQPTLNKSLITLNTLNIYENSNLQHFYETLDFISCFSGSLNTTTRRSFARQAIPIFESFIKTTFSPNELKYIDDLLVKKNESEKTKSRNQNEDVLKNIFEIPESNIQVVETLKEENIVYGGIFNTLTSISIEGVKILQITSDIDIPQLVKKYKLASKKHHPDIGGDEDTMKFINEIFGIFYKAILTCRNRNLNQYSHLPESIIEMKFEVNFILASLHADFLAADKAFAHYEMCHKMKRHLSSKKIGSFFKSMNEFLRINRSTLNVLGKLQMKKEFDKALLITLDFIDLFYKNLNKKEKLESGLNYYFKDSEISNYIKMNKITLKESLSKDFYKKKLILLNKEQVENALRLGKIDRKRYLATIKKFDVSENVQNSLYQTIQEYFDSATIQWNLHDQNYSFQNDNKKFIDIEYGVTRFKHLTSAQKREYLEIFREKKVTEKIKSFLEIRASEIMIGAIYNYANLDINSIIEELKFYTGITEIRKYFVDVLSLIVHLKELKYSERIEKIKILKELDSDEYLERNNDGVTFVMSYDQLGFELNGYRAIILPTDSYIEFALSEVKMIVEYANTGIFKSKLEAVLIENEKSLETLDNSKLGRNYFKSSSKINSNNLKSRIAIEEEYLHELFKLSKKVSLKFAKELYLPSKINQHIKLLSKIKDWKKIIYWIEKLNCLPVEFTIAHHKKDADEINKLLIKSRNHIDKIVLNIDYKK